MSLLHHKYKQKNDWTCGPAVARIILQHYGIRSTIPNLIKQLRTTRSGTENRHLLGLFERNNLKFSVKVNSSLTDIKKRLKTHWIIVVYWIPLPKEYHYSIVKNLNSKRIYFHDTWFGSNHSYTNDYFYKNWKDEKRARWMLAVKKLGV